MGRAEDAGRLKVLSERIAALRSELAELRAERELVLTRLRTLPHPDKEMGRTAIAVTFGEDGGGILLVDVPKPEVTFDSSDTTHGPRRQGSSRT